jgi:hypothetical protein
VDAVMPEHKSKVFTLYVDEDTSLDELVKEEIAHGIPFFRRLIVTDSSFFSHPLIPSFLCIYGTQIHTVYRPDFCGDDVVAEEVAFYHALPNLTQLSTNWLGDNVADVKLLSLERLQLHRIRSELSERAATINFDFLLNFPKLTHLWLPDMELVDYVELLITLGPYFAIRNGWDASLQRTLTIYVDPARPYRVEMNRTERQKLATLLPVLAVADGRILIENMPVELLDEAVRLFHHQRGGQLLSSFGMCIRSLIGFSRSLYELLELPNMRKLQVFRAVGLTTMDGNGSRTVSWPKLEEVKLDSCVRDERYLAKLVFGSGLLRPSVQQLSCNLKLLSQCSNEAHLLLGNFPNLTHLELVIRAEDVGLFRSLMRVLPTSCPKLQFLYLFALCPLRDEYFLGVDEEGGLTTTPPLLQFPGK